MNNFNTIVRTKNILSLPLETPELFIKRKCIEELRNYIFTEDQSKVLILYGLSGTGKTMMMYHIINEFDDFQLHCTAFIQAQKQNTMSDLFHDIGILEESGYKYVFIDEVTLIEDFVDNAAILADIYATSGMKIVLSGKDSLSFAFTQKDQLYDRCIMIHTTFIPYREFEEILGIKGIDEYIKYSGTLNLNKNNYNINSTFASEQTTNNYIHSAIAKNIQHSLKENQNRISYHLLLNSYEKGELTTVINKVIQSINISFIEQVIDKSFTSLPLPVTDSNLFKDRDNYTKSDKVTKGMMEILEILNKEEQTIEIGESHLLQIKEYLTLLDLIMDIDLEFLPSIKEKKSITVFMQPGLRYALSKVIVEKLLLDEKFLPLTAEDRKIIIDRLLSEIRGGMMEDIILLETKLANPTKKVFKLQFDVGEFDMVVYDATSLNCKIYEVKYSKEQVSEQYRHLIDPKKCELTEHRYGEIIGRYVIYRGESMAIDNIQYLNVEEYLKSL